MLLLEYVDTYCQSYIRSSGESLSRNQVWEWINDGLVIDAMEWIAHYFEHRDEPGWTTDWNGFYRVHVLPRVDRLNALSERKDHTM